MSLYASMSSSLTNHVTSSASCLVALCPSPRVCSTTLGYEELAECRVGTCCTVAELKLVLWRYLAVDCTESKDGARKLGKSSECQV